ncbi:MAG TPA: cytochrome c [Bryobacteraceae bacterium]|jgi:mono/diheme cytochrome c family protein
MKPFYFALTAAALLFGAWASWAQQDAKDIYLDKCAVCHGPDGAGKTAKGRKLKVKDVRTSKTSAQEMIKIVENGKGADMDGYGKQLSQQQIQAVVEYYRGLAAK